MVCAVPHQKKNSNRHWCNCCETVLTLSKSNTYQACDHVNSKVHQENLRLRREAIETGNVQAALEFQAAQQAGMDARMEVVTTLHKAIVLECAMHGEAFASTARTLALVQTFANTLINGRLVDEKEIRAVRQAGYEQIANTCEMLNLVCDFKPDGQEKADAAAAAAGKTRKQPQAGSLHRTTVSKHTVKTGKNIQDLKVAQWLRCERLGILIDGSTAINMGSTPLLMVLMGLTDTGEWIMMYCSQADETEHKDAQACYDLVKNTIDLIDPRLWPKVQFVATDGASVMRSSKGHAGVEGNTNDTASNFVTKFRVAYEALHPGADADGILAFHCVCHMANLGLGDAIKHLPGFFIKHVQKITSHCRTSAERLRRLGVLLQAKVQAAQANNPAAGNAGPSDYKVHYLSHYCPTRWLGLEHSLDSLLKNWPAFLEYKAALIADGCGPTDPAWVVHCSGDKCKVQHLGADPVGGEDLKHLPGDATHFGPSAAVFCQSCWADKTTASDDWDDAIVSCEQDLLEQNAITNETGATGLSASSTKRSVILNPVTGITALTEGLDYAVRQVLQPYATFTHHAQTTEQPVQHRIAGEIRTLILELKTWLPTHAGVSVQHVGPHGEWRDKWRDDTAAARRERGGCNPNPGLVAAVDLALEPFVEELVRSLEERFQPYLLWYDAWEAVDLSSAAVSINQVAGLKALCATFPNSYLNYGALGQQLRAARIAYSGNAHVESRRQMRGNLVKFYHDNRDAIQESCPQLWRLMTVTFSTPFCTAVVESLFSRFNYNKDKKRNRLNDTTASAILHTYDAVDPLLAPWPAGMLPCLPTAVRLNMGRCHESWIKWPTS